MNTENRIHYLDSIRGLAALSVVVFHCISNHWGFRTDAKISFLFFNGSDAVSLFFVLSGLVLTLNINASSSEQYTWQDYKNFIIKRLFRIYPAYIVCLVVYYIYSCRDLSLHNAVVNTFTNKTYFLQELLLIRENHNLYLPGWSLGIEIALSAFLPFLVLLFKYDKKIFAVFAVAALILNKHYISIFTLHFCFGIAIAFCYQQILTYDFKNSKWYKFRFLIYLSIFILYGFRHILSLFNDTSVYDEISGILYLDEFLFTGIGAAGILLFCINNQRAQNILSVKPLLFIGKISYSIYLTHWFFITILLDNWNYFYPMFNNEFQLMLFYLATTLIATFITSTIVYYFVEKPMIIFGRNLIAKLSS
mgnify:CR=1 FL=1